jgi:hypothetical protein
VVELGNAPVMQAACCEMLQTVLVASSFFFGSLILCQSYLWQLGPRLLEYRRSDALAMRQVLAASCSSVLKSGRMALFGLSSRGAIARCENEQKMRELRAGQRQRCL